jgi:hypothetical protein
MTGIEQTIQEILEIKKQYQAEVGSRRKPWPASIRNRIERLHRLGLKYKEISARIEIPYYSIMNWRSRERSQDGFRELTVRPAPALPVDARQTVTVATADMPVGSVTVTTPDGYRVACESTDLAVGIIRELRRG